MEEGARQDEVEVEEEEAAQVAEKEKEDETAFQVNSLTGRLERTWGGSGALGGRASMENDDMMEGNEIGAEGGRTCIGPACS